MKPWVHKATQLLTSSLQPPQHEHNELDWKGALSPDAKRLTEHLCAFANYPGGGAFAFGLDRSGTSVSLSMETVEEIINRLANLGRDAVEPPIQLDHASLQFNGAPILIVHVPESSVKPVHLRGKALDHTFVRSGATTRKASRQEIGAMMLHSQTPRWEDLHASTLMSDEVLLASLDVDAVLQLLQRPIPPQQEERLQWMAEACLIERHTAGGGYITNLGAISATKRFQDFPNLERKTVRVIHYGGLNKTKTLRETSGTLGYAIGFQRIIAYVCKLLPTSEVIQQALRQTKTVYPEIALREIIANALIHQDFTVTGAGPLIEIFDDRIEISNPGTLLPSKTADRIIGTQPESRNEKLASAFRMYRICEERGSGLIKAGIEVELYGLPPIKFEQLPNSFKVSLYAPKSFAQMSSSERLDACYQHAVLKYYSSSVMTNKILRERLKMPEKHRSMVSLLIQEALDLRIIAAANPDNRSRKFAEYLPFWAAPHS
jgi:predicted HTH transcriptional regulator